MKKIIELCIDIVSEFDTLTETLKCLEILHKEESETRILYAKKLRGKFYVRVRKRYPFKG